MILIRIVATLPLLALAAFSWALGGRHMDKGKDFSAAFYMALSVALVVAAVGLVLGW